MATHWDDIGDLVGAGELNGVVGKMVFGDIDSQGGEDGGDVCIVGAGWLLAQEFKVMFMGTAVDSQTPEH
jgi:hypothetical protein